MSLPSFEERVKELAERNGTTLAWAAEVLRRAEAAAVTTTEDVAPRDPDEITDNE